MSIFQLLWQALVDFIYPAHCLLCQTPLQDRPGLCAKCESSLCLWDGEIDLETLLPKVNQCIVLYDFNDALRSLVHLLKYRGKTWPGQMFGQVLGTRLAVLHLPEPVIVPVPLHSARMRERGYNQSAVIARAAGQVLGAPVCERTLKRMKATPSQTHLSARARRENVADAFGVPHPDLITGRLVVLVDDVMTTGATVDACTRALLLAGATEVLIGVVARPQIGEDRLVLDQP